MGQGISRVRAAVRLLAYAAVMVLPSAMVSTAGQTPPPAIPALPGAAAVPEAVTEAVESAAPAGADQIVIGAYLNDIQEIDFRTNSYAVDLYLWFRWTNPDLNPSKSFEFMNRYAPDDHVKSDLYETPQKMPDGSLYAIIRNQGRFSTKFHLETYPFDTQTLSIEVEDSTGGSAKQFYVADKSAMTVNPAITLPGFRLAAPLLDIVDNRYPTNFGDLTVEEQEAYSRARLLVPISRPMTAISIKTFVPIFLIIACAGLVFFIRPAYVDGRIGLGITALLTLVALQLTSGSSLPDVDYLMMLDKVYLASYAFIMLALVRVVASTWAAGDLKREGRVATIDRSWAAVIVLGYILALAAVGWGSLKGLM